MTVVWALFVVGGFAGLLALLELPDRAREVGDRARESLDVLRDPDSDDRTKEKALQRQSLRLFGLLGLLAGGSVVALGLPLFSVWLLDLLGLASLDGVLAMLARVDFLAAVTVAGALGWWVLRRLGHS